MLAPFRLVSVDIAQALQLAADGNLSAYDAYCVHCARTLSHPLLTLDARMRQAATELKIPTLDLPQPSP
jgi:predicted nucleic acid-binding protein